MQTPHVKLVAAPIAGAVYVKTDVCLTHVVELRADNTPMRVLCGKVKLTSILDDETQHKEASTATCKTCQKKLARWHADEDLRLREEAPAAEPAFEQACQAEADRAERELTQRERMRDKHGSWS